MSENSEVGIIKVRDFQDNISISLKNLWALSYSGEYGMTLYGKDHVVNRKDFIDFLNRNHFTARENKEDKPAVVDGEISEVLTYVAEPIDTIPKLYTIKEFVEQFSTLHDITLSERTVMRYCENGLFPHFRIGRGYRLSEQDIKVGTQRLFEMRSPRQAYKERRLKLL